MDLISYAAIRMKNWYEDLPSDDEIEGRRFWCMEQEYIYKDIYEPMKKVRPMQAINVDLLAENNHFEDAIWVTGRMGLQDLMKIQCDYSPELIKQFYATLAFKKDEDRTMEWMSGSTHCEATLRRFASILGLPEEGGIRLYGPQKTNKNVLLISMTHLERLDLPRGSFPSTVRCSVSFEPPLLQVVETMMHSVEHLWILCTSAISVLVMAMRTKTSLLM
jgi:hypothetical protein